MDESVLTERGDSPGTDSRSAAATLPVPPVPPVPPAPAVPAVPAQAAAPAPRRRAGGSRWSVLPYAAVLAAVAGGLTLLGLGGHVQAGLLAVAVAVLTAAAARLVLPERNAGLLVCRHRLTDVMVLACLGAGIMTITLVLPSPA